MFRKKKNGVWLGYLTMFAVGIFAIAGAVVAMPEALSAKVKAKTKSVMVRKGKKKLYKVPLKKIRKIYIKYSKKGIVKASVKKDSRKIQYVQITGKKTGRTTITVTIYETKKKCRTYKYKVTVKPFIKIPADTKKDLPARDPDLAGNTKSGNQNSTVKEINTGYTYGLEVLSCGGKAYGCSTSYKLTGTNMSIHASNGFTVLYIKTKDPDLESAQLYSDKSQKLKNMSLPPTKDYALSFYKYQFKDIRYVNYKKDANMNRVAGGYICAVKFSERDEIGLNHIIIKKKTGEGIFPIKGAVFSLNVLDPDPLETEFIDAVISEQTDPSASKHQQMQDLTCHIRSHWRYYSTDAYVQEPVW